MRQLEHFLGPGHPPIFITPHGTWEEACCSRSLGVEEVEARLARRQLLFFGTLRANKGLDMLLDAMAYLPEYGLMIAGAPVDKGYYMGSVRPKVDSLMRAGRHIVVLDRFLTEEEVAEAFAKCGTLVLPYKSFHSQSGVLFYAIANALPVVVTDVGALAETVREYGLGEVSRGVCAKDLAAAIRELEAADPRDLAHGIQRAREGLTWERCAEETLSGYLEVLATPS